jgi:uncharacterized protein
MTANVAGLFRHPVKGFTPEALAAAELIPGQVFPGDRVWAVENGPSGYDPAAPAFVPKTKFTVLAQIAAVARARTALSDDGVFRAVAEGLTPFEGRLADMQDREAFAAWVTELIGEDAKGPLRVVEGAGSHRFTDHPLGHVSIINLATIRDLEARIGRAIDPLRFRANLYVDGWPARAENDWTGRPLMLGFAEAKVFKPVVRCAAPDVNPTTAERDLETTKALFEAYGDLNCGIYVQVTKAGRVAQGDAVSTPEAA